MTRNEVNLAEVERRAKEKKRYKFLLLYVSEYGKDFNDVTPTAIIRQFVDDMDYISGKDSLDN